MEGRGKGGVLLRDVREKWREGGRRIVESGLGGRRRVGGVWGDEE